MNKTNGKVPETQKTDAQADPETKAGPSARFIAQYIKDLSFESPHAATILNDKKKQPGITVNVDVKGEKIDADLYEVILNCTVAAEIESKTAYLAEVAYGGLFATKNFPENRLGPLLLVEGPQLLFPYLRRIVADLINDGGFSAVNLDPINFLALYQREIQKRQKAEAESAATANPS